MSFRLRVYFSSLLDYVPNSMSNNGTARVGLCVVAPKALGHDARLSAGRGTKLGSESAIPIDGQRIVLQLSREGNASAAPFDFETPILKGDMIGVMPLEAMLGMEKIDPDPEVLAAAPPTSVVRSQILIGIEGSFHLAPTASPPKVELPVRGQKARTVTVAEEFYMEVADVQSANIITLPLTDTIKHDAIYPILPPSRGGAVLRFSQTCVQAANANSEDVDFRYHYLLMKTLPEGYATVGKMPVPKISKYSGDSQRFKVVARNYDIPYDYKHPGCNCAGNGWSPYPFNLEKFMQIKLPSAATVERSPKPQTK